MFDLFVRRPEQIGHFLLYIGPELMVYNEWLDWVNKTVHV